MWLSHGQDSGNIREGVPYNFPYHINIKLSDQLGFDSLSYPKSFIILAQMKDYMHT